MREKNFVFCQQFIEFMVLCPPSLPRVNFQDSSHSGICGSVSHQFTAFVQMHFLGIAVHASSDADDGRCPWGIQVQMEGTP